MSVYCCWHLWFGFYFMKKGTTKTTTPSGENKEEKKRMNRMKKGMNKKNYMIMLHIQIN